MKTIMTRIMFAAMAALFLNDPASATIARDFKITNRATGEVIRRDDFKGKILLLDFFAYWCPPCQASSPVVERDIAAYYKQRGGNPHGIPVEIIGVNIEQQDPDRTNAFIKTAGFERVADDFMASDGAWAQFGQGGVPHFVILNGTGGGSHRQWEVLHSAPGFRGAEFYRQLIDSIRPPTAGSEDPDISVTLQGRTGIKDSSGVQKFGNVASGSNRYVKTFAICNEGSEDLKIHKILKTGNHPSDFRLLAPAKMTLAPGECTSIRVVFQPQAMGVRSAMIKIVSNDPDESSFRIRLMGTGIPKRTSYP